MVENLHFRRFLWDRTFYLLNPSKRPPYKTGIPVRRPVTHSPPKYPYSKVPNKRLRRLLIFTFFSSVDALIPVSTIIEVYLDSLKNSIDFQ